MRTATERTLSPTERFLDALCELLPGCVEDATRVRLEDAFNDAVDERVKRVLAEARREEY